MRDYERGIKREFKDDINVCYGCKSTNVAQVGNIRWFDQSIHVIRCLDCRLISQYGREYDVVALAPESKSKWSVEQIINKFTNRSI